MKILISIATLLVLAFTGMQSQEGRAAEAAQYSNQGLVYDQLMQGPAPLPAPEYALQTVVAEAWFKAASSDNILEGAIFDAEGNLLFCDVTARKVMRLSQDKKLTTVVSLDGYAPGGLAFHGDGRLFIAALNGDFTKGIIAAVKPDGSDLHIIVSPDAGYLPNDLVFDAKGGFYFTDFKGTATQPSGGVYYVSPDFKTVTALIPNLAMANGVALSPDGKVVWATEFGRNLLHRVELADATTIAPIGSAVPYHFIGTAPDSMRCDADGNVYVAIYGQGRVMAFNPKGIPLGQILLPGRDNGQSLRSTSLAIRPGSRDLFAVSSDESGTQGSWVFRSKAFAKGLAPLNSSFVQ